jgi:hypothetical protein
LKRAIRVIIGKVEPDRRQDMHDGRQPGHHLLLHQRGMEMARIDDDQATLAHGG